MRNVAFHPEMLVVDAARIARSQGCTLRYEGNRFVARPIIGAPKKNRHGPCGFVPVRTIQP